MDEETKNSKSESVALLIGAGLLAGTIGTAVITLSRGIHNKIKKVKEPETFPADFVEKLFGISAVNGEKKIFLAALVHWLYGISLGLIRSIASIAGKKGILASIFHAIVIQLIAMIFIPKMIGASIKKINIKDSSFQLMHHLFYAIAAGLVVDNILKKKVED